MMGLLAALTRMLKGERQSGETDREPTSAADHLSEQEKQGIRQATAHSVRKSFLRRVIRSDWGE